MVIPTFITIVTQIRLHHQKGWAPQVSAGCALRGLAPTSWLPFSCSFQAYMRFVIGSPGVAAELLLSPLPPPSTSPWSWLPSDCGHHTKEHLGSDHRVLCRLCSLPRQQDKASSPGSYWWWGDTRILCAQIWAMVMNLESAVGAEFIWPQAKFPILGFSWIKSSQLLLRKKCEMNS